MRLRRCAGCAASVRWSSIWSGQAAPFSCTGCVELDVSLRYRRKALGKVVAGLRPDAALRAVARWHESSAAVGRLV